MERISKIFKTYTPLITMFLLVGLTTFLLSRYVGFDSPMRVMEYFMGSFFGIFALLKIARLRSFAIAYRKYDLIAMRSDLYAHLYPFIELALAIAYFTSFATLATNTITLVLMSIGTLGVYLKLRQHEEIPCACLGTVFKVPMTWVTLVEDLVMAVMALIMIVI